MLRLPRPRGGGITTRTGRRLAAAALLMTAASSISGCCSEGAGGWAAFLLGGSCGLPVTVEIAPLEGAVVAGKPVRLSLRVDRPSDPVELRDYYWDLDGDRVTDKHLSGGFVPHGDGSVEHTFPRAGRVRVGVEVVVVNHHTAEADGRGRASLEIDVLPQAASPDPLPPPDGNRPPIAEFVVPAVVARGRAFLLDARASRDEDGAIVRHSWDVEGDAAPEFEGRLREFVYTTPGEKTITLTVEDDRGATATTQRTVLVTGEDRAAAGTAARGATRRPGARAAAVRRFTARVSGLFPARAPKPTARGLALSGLRGSGRLRARLRSPLPPLGRLADARWRGRLRFFLDARTGIVRLRGTVLARGSGRRPPRVCLRVSIIAPPFGRPVTGRLTVLGGTRTAAFLRGFARFTVEGATGPAQRLRGRFAVRKRTHPRGLAACRKVAPRSTTGSRTG